MAGFKSASFDPDAIAGASDAASSALAAASDASSKAAAGATAASKIAAQSSAWEAVGDVSDAGSKAGVALSKIAARSSAWEVTGGGLLWLGTWEFVVGDDLCVGGTPSMSGIDDAADIFDNDLDTWAGGDWENMWVVYQLTSVAAVSVLRIRTVGAGDAGIECAPHHFILEGSNTGAFGGEQTLLYTKHYPTETPSDHYAVNTWYDHPIVDCGEYLYYRLFVYTSEGGAGYSVRIAEIELLDLGTSYALNDVVDNDGVMYSCILTHLASDASEPGVGASWETYWVQMFSSGDLAAAAASDAGSKASVAAAAASNAASAASDALSKIAANSSSWDEGVRSAEITTIAAMTSSAYAALSSTVSTTLYVITD